ncbi:MAG: hypothetical protein NZM25_11330 [Leptospiraceae bacterium]|nr:hypothetical protein [Leptospiraceae bacterium]MDW8307605.1 hypothetical protein [Leptospiraceae bacterium]
MASRELIRLLLPRNFAFVKRLPNKFEALILAQHNSTPRGRWYEVEILGQKLNLMSQIELPLHKKVVLEKDGLFKLRLVQVMEEKNEGESISKLCENVFIKAVDVLPEDPLVLLFLQQVHEEGGSRLWEKRSRIYRFHHPLEEKLQGVFHEYNGTWHLLLPKEFFSLADVEKLELLLKDCRISQIKLIPKEELEKIQSVDIWG